MLMSLKTPHASFTLSKFKCIHLPCSDLTIHLCFVENVEKVRLRGGQRSNEGRVEVYHRGGWGTICPSFSWDTRDAAVICKQLGFPGGMSAPPSAHFGRGSGPVWFGIVDCNGDEKIFDECYRYGLGAHYCSHSKDASVVCRKL